MPEEKQNVAVYCRKSTHFQHLMTEELVDLNGVKVIQGWPERLEFAQKITVYKINGIEYRRIPYGDEGGYASASHRACRDCAALKEQFHVLGCDVERCAVCDEQAHFCDCEIETFGNPS